MSGGARLQSGKGKLARSISQAGPAAARVPGVRAVQAALQTTDGLPRPAQLRFGLQGELRPGSGFPDSSQRPHRVPPHAAARRILRFLVDLVHQEPQLPQTLGPFGKQACPFPVSQGMEQPRQFPVRGRMIRRRAVQPGGSTGRRPAGQRDRASRPRGPSRSPGVRQRRPAIARARPGRHPRDRRARGCRSVPELRGHSGWAATSRFSKDTACSVRFSLMAVRATPRSGKGVPSSPTWHSCTRAASRPPAPGRRAAPSGAA